MENVARKIEVKAVFQEFGEIVAVAGEVITVRTALAEVKARRAASCLLDPAAGDRVLLASEDRGDTYVLAVLEQRDPGASLLSVQGDLTLRSQGGKVTLAAQEGIDLVTGAAARIMASTLDVEAVDTISVLSGALKAEVGKAKVLATSLDAFFERVRQHSKSSLRTVDEIDQVRAEHIDYAAQGNAHLRGENAMVTAHDLVKLNAEQVHVG